MQGTSLSGGVTFFLLAVKGRGEGGGGGRDLGTRPCSLFFFVQSETDFYSCSRLVFFHVDIVVTLTKMTK